jgi:hypothetical protein
MKPIKGSLETRFVYKRDMDVDAVLLEGRVIVTASGMLCACPRRTAQSYRGFGMGILR